MPLFILEDELKMMSLQMGFAKLAVRLVRFLSTSRGLVLLLALAALPGRAHEVRSAELSGVQTDAATSAACGPGWAYLNAPPIRITDRLVLSVPLRYIRYVSLNCGRFKAGIPASSPTRSTWTDFDFFLPDFSGYTIERLRNPFDINEVQVAYVASATQIEAFPNHPVHYPSNQLKNVLHYLADPKTYRDMYGLRCYDEKTWKTKMYCYSARAGNDHEGILLIVDIPPYGPGITNPLIQTDYFSKRYGGIEIAWRTNAKNLPRWRDIDAQIWKFIASWNVAHTP
jgi:hypothetical protein